MDIEVKSKCIATGCMDKGCILASFDSHEVFAAL